MHHRRIGTCFLLWVVLPAALFEPSDTIPFPTLGASLYHLNLFLWVFAAAAFLKRRSGAATGLRVLAAVVGLYFALTYLLMAYGLLTGHAFDVRFALDSARELPTTVAHVLGPQIALLFAAVGTLWLGLTRLAHRAALGHEWRLRARPGFAVVCLSAGLIGLYPDSVSYPGQSLANLVASLRYAADVRPIAEAVVLADAAQSDENVFFVQLESVNALAAFGRGAAAGKRYDGRYVPELEAIAREGVLFPLAWGNTMQTARALESALCGVSNNAGPPLTFHPEEIRTPCLSELLRSRGFATLFAGGSRDPDFHNIAGFLRAKGFDAVLGPDLMPGGSHTYWGYDECEFFDRVASHLEQQYPEPRRLFAWIAVSRHHYPFEDGNRDADQPFPEADNFLEQYLSSLWRQDRCLGAFWQRLAAYAGPASHVFVFGDHSWPVGILGSASTHNERGSHVENFAVPIAYVPPRARAAEFAIGTRPDARVAQTDLPATVLDLLGLGGGPSSFASSLRGASAAAHEECHVLVQPYGDPSIVVARRTHRHTYQLASGTLTRHALGPELDEGKPEPVARDLPYARFAAEYGCRRHRGAPAPG